jgi:hypothetical protein
MRETMKTVPKCQQQAAWKTRKRSLAQSRREQLQPSVYRCLRTFVLGLISDAYKYVDEPDETMSRTTNFSTLFVFLLI